MKKIISYLVIVIGLFGCTMKNPIAPYMVDRTTGWSPSVICSSLFDVETDSSNHDIFYSFIFDGSNLTKDKSVQIDLNDNDVSIMETALRAAFEDQYAGIGKGSITVFESEQNYIKIFATNQVAVLIDTKSNTLLQCIDPRIQPQFEIEHPADIKKGCIKVNIDIATLTKEELCFYQETLVHSIEGDSLVYKDDDLLLTAEKAFEVTVDSIYKRYSGKAGALGTVGGAFIVYRINASDSFLIFNKQFVQILDYATGQRIFLVGGAKDLSECQIKD